MHAKSGLRVVLKMEDLSSGLGDRCRYHSLMLVQCNDMLLVVVELHHALNCCTVTPSVTPLYNDGVYRFSSTIESATSGRADLP